jgi:hypothetical protein
MNEQVSYAWVRQRLICEFDHWDVVLQGLIEDDGVNKFVKIIGPDERVIDQYTVHEIDWTEECDEFLADYRKAYAHWFPIDGKRSYYDGRDLSWFIEKWRKRNPIIEKVKP